MALITAEHHNKHRLRLISSPHAVDCQNQDIDILHLPLSDCNIHWIDTGDSKIGSKRTFPTPHWSNHAAMTKYTIATLQAMVGVKPTGPIDKIQKRLTFSTLWHLQCQIVDGLHKVGNVNSPLDGHTGYILLKEVFTLFSSKEWRYPEEVG